jgi:hypothetical protein
VPADGGGAKYSSTRAGPVPQLNAWCQVPAPKNTASPGDSRTTVPASGSATATCPATTYSTSSAPNTVRCSGEWVNWPPGGISNSSWWIRSLDT